MRVTIYKWVLCILLSYTTYLVARSRRHDKAKALKKEGENMFYLSSFSGKLAGICEWLKLHEDRASEQARDYYIRGVSQKQPTLPSRKSC